MDTQKLRLAGRVRLCSAAVTISLAISQSPTLAMTFQTAQSNGDPHEGRFGQGVETIPMMDEEMERRFGALFGPAIPDSRDSVDPRTINGDRDQARAAAGPWSLSGEYERRIDEMYANPDSTFSSGLLAPPLSVKTEMELNEIARRERDREWQMSEAARQRGRRPELTDPRELADIYTTPRNPVRPQQSTGASETGSPRRTLAWTLGFGLGALTMVWCLMRAGSAMSSFLSSRQR